MAGDRGLLKSVCVFCGANPGNRPVLAGTARAMGEALARRGITLVFGGGRVGLMGASSSPRLVVLLRGALDSILARQGHRVPA